VFSNYKGYYLNADNKILWRKLVGITRLYTKKMMYIMVSLCFKTSDSHFQNGILFIHYSFNISDFLPKCWCYILKSKMWKCFTMLCINSVFDIYAYNVIIPMSTTISTWTYDFQKHVFVKHNIGRNITPWEGSIPRPIHLTGIVISNPIHIV